MLGELFAEVAHEAATTAFLIEVVQFVILAGIVWVVAVGFGKRRGFVANMLSERHRKTIVDLDAACQAPEELERERAYASGRRKTARAEADELLSQTKAEITASEAAEHAKADADAAALLARAEATLATESEEMHAELREQLVEVVTQSTRRILNERMTLSEQRRLIEEHVTSAVSDLGSKEATVR